MKRAAVFALALVVLGALWLSGSATLHLGVLHGVPGLAQPALVVVLEVASVIGTALWVTAESGRRWKPASVVLLSSGVAAVGGWQSYGWLGLVAPIAVVLVTDMVAERWRDLSVRTPDPGRTMPVHRHAKAQDDSQAIQPPPSPSSPDPSPVPAGQADDVDEEAVLAWLGREQLARGRVPGRDAVTRAWPVGSKRADRLLREYRARPRLSSVPVPPPSPQMKEIAR